MIIIALTSEKMHVKIELKNDTRNSGGQVLSEE